MDERRILVIDDDPRFCRGISELLASYGYTTVIAGGGAEGLALARADPPFTGVFVDLVMPQVDGLEIIAALTVEQPELPLIAISGTVDLREVVRAMREGAWDYIRKPIQDVDEIIAVLERAQARAQRITGRARADEALRANENLRREEERLSRSSERIKLLRKIDQAILTAQSSRAISQVAVTRIRQLIPCEQASLVALDWNAQKASVLAASTGDHVLTEDEMPLDLIEQEIIQVFRQGEVFAAEDIQADLPAAPILKGLIPVGTRSFISLPLIANGEPIAALNLSRTEPGPFLPEHVEIAQQVADLLTVALRQARLVEQVERRAADLEAFHAISEAVSRSLDLETLLGYALDTVLDLTGLERGQVRLLTGQPTELKLIVGSALSEEFQRAADSVSVGACACGLAALHGEPIVIRDVNTDARVVNVVCSRDGVNSLAVVPLAAGAEVLGTLQIASLTPRLFSDAEIRMLKAIGQQIGVAVKNASYYEEAQRQAQELAALNAVTAATTSTLDLSEILDLALEQARSLTGLEGGIVCLIPPGQDILHLAIERGASPEMIADLTQNEVRIGECLCGDAAQSQQPVILWDNASSSTLSREAARNAGINFHGAFPVVVAGRSIGVLCVFTRTAIRPSARSLEILQIACDSVAIAIENALLYEQARQEIDDRRQVEEQSLRYTQRLQILRDIYQAILAAESPEAIAQAALGRIRKLVAYQRASVALFDFKADMTIRQIAVVADTARAISQREKRIPIEHFHGLDILRQLGEFVVDDIRAVPEPSPGELGMAERGIRSYANVPLHVGGRLIGSLNVESTKPRDFTTSKIDILREVTGPLALAIHQADLHDQIRHHADEMEQRVASRTKELSVLYQVSAIAIESLDIGVALEQSLKAVLENIESQSGAIQELNEARTRLRLTTHFGLSQELVAELDNIPADEDLAGIVTRTGEPVVVSNAQPVPKIPGAFAAAGFQSYIGVPVRAGGEVAAVLSVFGQEEEHLTVEEIALLGAVADHIGMAIENARLWQRAERAAALEERERLAQDLHDSVTQSLYSLSLFARAAQEHAKQENWERLGSRLADIRESSLLALKEMRLLVHQLRPSALQQEGLAQALQKRLDAVEKRSGLDATLLVDGSTDLPQAMEMSLYLLALEALNNALKHAGASKVSVSLRMAPKSVELIIEDDGTGFDLETVEHKGGMGLANMRARVAKMGGSISIRSAPGEGALIDIKVNPMIACDSQSSQEL